MKTCRHCNSVLPESEFHVRRLSCDGLNATCKTCANAYKKLDYIKHRAKRLASGRQYNAENPERNRAKARAWYAANRERALTRIKQHAVVYRPARNIQLKNRFHTDPNYKIAVLTRGRISAFIKGMRKVTRSAVLLGATLDDVKQHLESQFLPGMSWENHGKLGWHIDHIRPCASFDLTDPEQQKQCFHYTNLQPLWAIDNLRKCAKWAA